MDHELIQKARRRGIYLLPNLFTTAGLFAGFYAIVAAMKGYYDAAAVAMFIAMLADALDGRLARLLHSSTEFGVQYDSLSDMVSFGIAPALVLYSWALKDLGKIGWLIAFFYTACAALRLARFNVQTGESDKRFFMGLPTPASAAVVASLIWSFHTYLPDNLCFLIVVSIVTLILATFMISNVLYRSFKEFNIKNKISFISLFAIILVFIAISINPPLVLFIIFALYALSGPLYAFIRRYKRFKMRHKSNEAK